MKHLIAALLLFAVIFASCECLANPGILMGQRAEVVVSNSRLRKTTDYSENLVVEAYVDNLSEKYAKDISVRFVVTDPTGVTGFDGSTNARTYGSWSAIVPELGPKSAKWVTIATAIGKPQNINEGRKSFDMEVAGPSASFSNTRVTLTYDFKVSVGTYSDH